MQDPKTHPKIAIWAPSHNFVGGRSENRRPPQTTADRTAHNRIPLQNAPQTTTERTADHHKTAQDAPQNTLQDVENNFISFQTWFHVKIKH